MPACTVVAPRPRPRHSGVMPDSPLQVIDSALFLPLIERARQSPRLRTNHNFHTSIEDNPRRFLNVMIQGTYVAPHRHRDPPKSESFLVLEGELAFFTFDDAGQITNTLILGRDAVGVDMQPGVWHTVTVLSQHVVCFEVKPGPYSAANDKEFAPWAPREGNPSAAAYLDMLVSSVSPPTL
jgi:cupin fold WbuC family metalloprotein